ncbi:retinol dehydrogenase 10-like protein [Saccoglossus kowalevskii]|uniref:Retinol dehydrogenase 10-like protein n=1 Tax=Saccoglossus kowalevskii TaxID=10224 RepID=D1LXC9_SACKO|nr:retinol dehydrogenase 10-like protein [Saccoglossus kowalevskii]ACY92635.1 retinol dehydrogenase 10-like protein [Saccoglossus kowalevskii]
MLVLFEVTWALLKITWYNMVGVWRCFVAPAKKSLVGEIVLITGAGSGIGRLMAINFAKQGCKLVIWDIDKDGGDKTADQITALGATAHSYRCDVTNKDEVYRLAEQVKKDVGSVTILVNNAGVVAGTNFLDCPDELILRSMNVNAISNFWTVKAFAPSMIAKNHGHIVTISSMAGTGGTAGMVEYCASKFASVGFHEALYCEFVKEGYDGVHMTLVLPYKIDTGMFDGLELRRGFSPPALRPEYVADKVLHAVQTNQKILIMPRDLYIAPWLKSWLSVDAAIVLAELSGALTAMDTFVGRKKKET